MQSIKPGGGLTGATQGHPQSGDWSRNESDFRPEATVHGLFRERAALHPGRTALCWRGGDMSYGELDRRSDRLARRLLAAGALPDRPVALCLPRSAEAVVAALAILKAGAAYLPMDPAYPRARLQSILADAKASLLLTDTAHAPALAGLATLLLAVDQEDGGQDDTAPVDAATAKHLAYVMYTSGSTGMPKGVQIEHRSIVRLVGAAEYVRLDGDTCFLHAAPLGFDASTLELWGPLLNGGRCALFESPLPDARSLAATIGGLGVTHAWLTAALFNSIVDEDPQALRGLRELLTGGEALSPRHVRIALQALPALVLSNGYGPTECTTFATTYRIPHDLASDANSIPIGRPIAGTSLHVLAADGTPVAAGESGELHIGGRGVARGYLGRPDLDAERFVETTTGERVYRTGDLVRWREDGVLMFLGRADQQVKIRGFRIEPGEIEAVIAARGDIRACAVVAREGAAGEKRLVAYVVPETASVDIPALRAHLQDSLPEYMVPSALVALDALPVTANGKLDRASLPAPGQARPELARPFRAPAPGLESALCARFADLLSLDQVGADDGFFELGGDSLLALRLLHQLRMAGIADLTPVQLFEAPTPAGMAASARGVVRTPAPGASKLAEAASEEPIAIVGMAGRFPGADDVEAFWKNLCAGTESIRMFSPQEIDPSIPAAIRDHADYVRARGVLGDTAGFDAGFFGISPLEAQLMDPQHRHFLETAWLTLENAGYVPETAPGRVGVFGGMYNATYYQRHVLPQPELIARLGELPTMLANEKDYLTSRVAYKLGLDGPAVSVHTACSTSLVAAIMAMESLRRGDCELALAGGVAITCPPDSGYLYQEGAMASPDGHTRTFDADAAGTVFSDGVAMVALRRLSDAIADGDTVYAVLLGGAINNDGAERASFTAPSPNGQSSVIALAHDRAGIDARSISYVEAHGTATPLGDPIEIEGLTRAFRRHTDDTGFCAIGSLKSNVGHLVIAAGAASLIKTSLSLHRRTLPPTIGFDTPNPHIDFAASPFVPQAALSAWPQGQGPRRAGVSAFGFGGTNAHVVMEEAPGVVPSSASTRPSQLLLLSARTAEALEAGARSLAACLESGHAPSLADIAHTLRVGRRGFSHRRAVVASNAAEAACLLRESPASRPLPTTPPGIAFLAPGQGSQYAAMGRGLYDSEPAFRTAYDECCDQLQRLTGVDPRAAFFSEDADALLPTSVTQPAIFTLEYALAKLWMHWGIVPTALVGHSVGEFVCAVIAGVMSLADALALVELRGRLMQALPAGSMLSVRLPAAEAQAWLEDGVELAAENGPSLCVLAGPTAAIERIETALAAAGVAARKLVTSHAFHSAMMEPVVAPMRERLRTIDLQAPRIPILSTVTATWLEDAQARDPDYWAQHLRRPVRFAPAVARLLEDPSRVLVEIGPRATLTTLAHQVAGKRSQPPAIASLGDSPAGEPAAIAAALGKLWTLGASPDWKAYVAHESRHRVSVPGYAFQHQRYWIDAALPASVRAAPVEDPLASGATDPSPAVAMTPADSGASTHDALFTRLQSVIEEVSGLEIEPAERATPWLELGLDSLALTQLALQVQRSFKVKVSFRQMMEQYGSMASLLEYLAATVEDAVPVAKPAVAVAEEEDGEGKPQAYDVKKAFGAIARIHNQADPLTPLQRERLDALVARYTARTGRSKDYTARHRQVMADPRVVNGFRPLTKELAYQLVIERSRDSRMWDLDGNEYVDVLSGFGMNLFGWQPDFLREVLHRQIEDGYEIGPQHVLAGETAELFAKVTQADRVAFCNTGSEAVMGAMRIARTVTGRSTIAIFTGAYHGIFDEVIVRGTRKLKSIPAAPGIMASASQNVLVLDYGTEESMRILRERAHELAAILVEPVQSRRPDFQPVEFLRELRELTRESGSVLIFDEVVTGFRAHPRGIQGLFDIDADLACYGKVVGGGFPIGVIAGKRAFMDALDGGHWEYGDESIPTVGVTYFAGTFVRHPLALAAAKASLQRLHDEGPALQERLTQRTAGMVAQVNAAMRQMGAPFKLATFASLWRNVFTEDLPYGDLIYVMLRDRGIHILDNFPCFLTTAHTDEDVALIVEAYRGAAQEMIDSGFFPVVEQAALPVLPAGVARRVPSTQQQREVWFADRMGREGSLAYNESITLHLRGTLDLDNLQAAIRTVVARHDALRSSFTADGLWLDVHEAAPALTLELQDLSVGDDPQAALSLLADAHVSEPFDLVNGPLLRTSLARLGQDHHALVLTGHHIVLDGWSFWVLVSELAVEYSRLQGKPGQRLPQAPSFADYAADSSVEAANGDDSDDLSWWMERFADGGPVLELPTDRPRPRVRTQPSERLDHLLPADLLAALRKTGAKRGASLFATLLAGFSTLLHRLTGQEDLVVGIPVAGQANGPQGLVGHCVSLLPLRVQAHGELPFSALLDDSRTVLLDAQDHQRVTFGRLLQALPLARDPARLPLVSVLFNIDQAMSLERDAVPGLQFEVAGNARHFETFELFVNAVDLGNDGMRLECQYNTDLFDRQTVERWMQCFQQLLAAVSHEVERPLGRLPLLDEAAERQFAAWNQTQADYAADARVEALVFAQAWRTPESIAVQSGKRTLSYAQLRARSESIARGLRAAGVEPGQRIGLLRERDLDLLPSMLGTWLAGAAYVPLDPTFPGERLAYMATDAGLRHVLTSESLAATRGQEFPGVELLTLENLGEGNHAPLPTASAEDDAYVIYTSGSTGQPKGVCVPHRAVANFLESMRVQPGLDADTLLAAVTTLSFDIAVLELLLPLVVGGQVLLVEREQAIDGRALRALLEQNYVNAMQATPMTWRLLLEAGWEGGPHWKALCGGEPMPPDIAAALLTRTGELWNLYGPTETTVWSSAYRVQSATAPVPIGRPIANTQLHIMDADLAHVPAGVVGELCIGGDGVARGYLDRPELTAERFVQTPHGRLYRTGDLARWRNDGIVECLGRNDFQVKLRGYRIELGEIEQQLCRVPGVAQAVVVLHAFGPGDERLVAYLKADPQADEDTFAEDRLRAHLAALLPAYMLPARYVTVSAFPLTGSGKIDRKALPAPAAPLRAEPAADGAAFFASATESAVAAHYRRILGLERVEAGDNFFALGGHSLLAAQLVAKLATEFGCDVPLRVAFEFPSVAALAGWLQQQTGSGGAAMAIAPAPPGHAPLSLMQQRLWYLEQWQPGRSVYNVPSAHALQGRLDRDALQRALAALVQRQASLRTVIGTLDGEPFQRVLEDVPVALPLEDLSSVPAERREETLQRLLEDQIALPFALEEGPLFRARLYALDDTHHVLFFMAHHLVWDGWSFDLFYEEMATLYAAFADGGQPTLPVLPASYVDFSAWHRDWLAGPELDRQLQHWQHKLQGAPEALDLPLDHARPATPSNQGDTVWLRIPEATVAALRARSQAEGSTLFMTLLSAWSVLLHQASGQRDLVIGTPVRGRSLPELDALMGFFVNALPLRVQLDPDQSFTSLLASVRSEVVEAFGFQDVPFEHLVRVLDTRRDASRFPIYQAFFSYQDARQRPSRWGALVHQNVPVFQAAAAQDIALWFLDGSDGLVGGLNYSTDILLRDSAELFKQRYLWLLEAIAAGDNGRIADLLRADEGDRDRIALWNATARDLGDATLWQHLAPAFAANPDRIAVRQQDASMTYASLESDARRVAAGLQAHGVGPGSVVGLHLKRTPSMLSALLGVLRAGAAYLPLDPDFPVDRLSFMLEDSGASLVLHDAGTLPFVGYEGLQVTLEALVAGVADTAVFTEPALDEDALAYLIYTSGSTGQPKGVRVPQRAVVNFLRSMRDEPGFDADTRLAAVTTLSFDIAVLELLLPLAVGGEVVLATREQASDGHALRTLCETHRVNAMQATPLTWRLLLEAGWRGGAQWKALCGGEAMPGELAEALLPRVGELWNLYGPTETTVWSTCARIRPGQGDIVIGRPIANTQVQVVDAEGRPQPVGVPGEIVIGGAGVALGYHRRDDLTAEKFIAAGDGHPRRYRTGDLGRWRSDGQLQHLGRLDHQVKLRGYRIETGEIEVVLSRHPSVAQAVVASVPGPGGEAMLAAYLLLHAGAVLDPDALRAHLRRSVPDYMVPGAFVPIDQVPVTSNGKVDRKALPALAPALQAPRDAPRQAPRTPTERKVADLWQELLEVDEVSLLDNFLDLGGHSLLVMRAVALLEARTGARLNPRAFVFQTLEQIAAECDALAPQHTGEAEPATLASRKPKRGLFGRVLARLGGKRG